MAPDFGSAGGPECHSSNGDFRSLSPRLLIGSGEFTGDWTTGRSALLGVITTRARVFSANPIRSSQFARAESPLCYAGGRSSPTLSDINSSKEWLLDCIFFEMLDLNSSHVRAEQGLVAANKRQQLGSLSQLVTQTARVALCLQLNFLARVSRA